MVEGSDVGDVVAGGETSTEMHDDCIEAVAMFGRAAVGRRRSPAGSRGGCLGVRHALGAEAVEGERRGKVVVDLGHVALGGAGGGGEPLQLQDEDLR